MTLQPQAVPERLLSINEARAVVGALKNVKRISYPVLVRLVMEEGLPKVPNPFHPGTWAFKRSQIEAWYESYTASTPERNPLRGPGRPRP